MIRFDFSEYYTLSDCPLWWRNLISEATKDLPSDEPNRDDIINAAMDEYGYVVIDPAPAGIKYVVFNDEIAFLACVMKWDYKVCHPNRLL